MYRLYSVAHSYVRRKPSPLLPTQMKLREKGAHDGGATSKIDKFIGKAFRYSDVGPHPTRTTAWLDGLRGVAAFLVMVFHYHGEWYFDMLEAPYGTFNTSPWEIQRLPGLRMLFCSGHTQVSIFFVISGFALSWSSMGSIRMGRLEAFAQSLGSMALRRWMRLFLPCFLVGFLRMVLFRYYDHKLVATKREDTLLGQIWDYISACETFANPFHLERTPLEMVHKYAWVFWTISLEWTGSLFVFVVLILVGRIQNYVRRTVVIGVVTAYACWSTRWTYWLFGTGMLLADYTRQMGGFGQLSKRLTIRTRVFWILVLFLGLFFASFPEKSITWDRGIYDSMDRTLRPHSWTEIEHGDRYWWCWSAICLILGISHLSSLRSIFETPLALYLGKISFMLYLSHTSVKALIGPAVHHFSTSTVGKPVWIELAQRDVWFVDGVFSNLLVFAFDWIVLMPVNILVAAWMQKLVDEPCLNFARWVDGFLCCSSSSSSPSSHSCQRIVTRSTIKSTHLNDFNNDNYVSTMYNAENVGNTNTADIGPNQDDKQDLERPHRHQQQQQHSKQRRVSFTPSPTR